MMDTVELKAFCGALPGATSRLLGHPSNILVYAVGDKNFAWFKTSDPERWRFSVRTTPDRFLELTDQPGVRPARYMARFHWVTIVDVKAFDEDYLRELVAWSWRRAVSGLPRYRREHLAGLAHADGANIAAPP